MTENNELIKFLDAQNQVYLKALSEIKKGKKTSHWMWFIFPQIKGLGSSVTAKFYEIKDLNEATAYLRHPILGKHLIEISGELLKLEGKTAIQILGKPDDKKLRSCMTLFINVENSDAVFTKVLQHYFNGVQDELTLNLIKK
ncbi:MAG: DUF1810 domain-containing protein [Flavobacterium sp.]|nr:DUF1810 domain-containing protein [Flavobacterium sp.]